jgi:hypothetical protein
VEGGFLTERGESRLIANSDWRKRLAQAICSGIENFRALAETKKRPMVAADYRREKIELAAREKQPSPVPVLSLDMSHPPPPALPSPADLDMTPTPSPTGSGPAEP